MDRIEGTRWNEVKVLESKSEKDFVKLHMGDPGVYAGMDAKKKESTLKLVYSIATGVVDVAKTKEELNPPAETLDAE